MSKVGHSVTVMSSWAGLANETPKNYNQLSMKEKKDIIRVDKMKNLAAQLKAREDIKPGDVKYIVPQSAEMIALVRIVNNS